MLQKLMMFYWHIGLSCENATAMMPWSSFFSWWRMNSNYTGEKNFKWKEREVRGLEQIRWVLFTNAYDWKFAKESIRKGSKREMEYID